MERKDYGTMMQNEIEKNQLTQVLTRLSASIETLIQTQREMQAQDKLDISLKNAAAMSSGNSLALDRYYQESRQSVFHSDIAPVIQNIQNLNTVSSNNYQQMMANQQALDAWNAAQSGAPRVTPLNTSGVFDQANVFAQQYQQAATPLMGSPVWNQYMLGVGVDPLLDRGPIANRPYSFGFDDNGSFSTRQPMSVGMEMNYLNFYQRGLGAAAAAGNADTRMVSDYYNYQRSMFENSQQMFLNSTVSNTLGVSGGAINRTEFEQGYMPALTKFGDVMGTDLSSSIGILKQLKDIHAIAAEINSGRTVDIANGVDSALRVFKSLSVLINSTDVSDLMEGVKKVSAFGAGNFNQGLQAVLAQTPGVPQSVGDRFSDVMSVSDSPYMQQFGYNRAGIEMSLFNKRAVRTFDVFGDQDVNRFLGGAQGASGTMTNLIGRVISNPYIQAMEAGGGDILGGAVTLGENVARDPYEFFIGRNQKLFDLRNKYAGEAGFRAMEYMMLPEASKYGLSRDQYLLALSGGDPESVVSYRKFKQAREGEQYSKREQLFRAREALNYMDMSKDMSERDVARITGGVMSKDIDWEYYASRGDSGSGPITRNIENWAAGLTASNRLRSWEDVSNAVMFVPGVGMPLSSIIESGRIVASGELSRAVRGYEFKDKYARMEEIAYSDSFNPDMPRKAGVRYIANVDFTRGKSVLSQRDMADIDTKTKLSTALSTTVDRALTLLEEIVTSPTGGVTAGEVQAALAEAVNLAMSNGTISGDDNRMLINYIRKSSLEDIKAVLIEQFSEDNPWVELLMYYSNPAMMKRKGAKYAGKNAVATSLRNMGMSEAEVNATIGWGSGIGEFAGYTAAGTLMAGATVGSIALTASSGGLGALAGTAAVMGATAVAIPVAKATTEAVTGALQSAGEFFGSDTIFSEKGVERFFFGGEDDEITREIKLTIGYIWGVLERGEGGIFTYNTRDTQKKEAIRLTWRTAYDTCTTVYRNFVSQNKPAVGAGKPPVVLPERNIKEASDATYKSVIGSIQEKGFFKDMEGGDTELRKAIVAVCATMLNPKSALYKTISGGSTSTRKTIINAMYAILEKESFTGGDLLSITNYSNKILGSQSMEGAVKFANQAITLSGLAATAPSAEAVAAMAQSIETDIIGMSSSEERAQINSALKNMGGLSGLAKAIKSAVAGDLSDLTDNSEISVELAKDNSAVKKVLERHLGSGVSDLLTRYKEKGMTKEQTRREVEGMLYDQMQIHQKASAIDPIEQQKLIRLIESTVLALSESPDIRRSLDKMGLT